ncbi:MAG: ASKHA domain-containing protein [Oscillospiraceae bacterium]
MNKVVITLSSHGIRQRIAVEKGVLLSSALNRHGAHIDMPCAGQGTCKSCWVWVNGKKRLACQTTVEADSYIELNQPADFRQIEAGAFGPVPAVDPIYSRFGISIDIGTTTICASLLDEQGGMSTVTRKNPQTRFGADVIHRIEKALSGEQRALSQCIRNALAEMIWELCAVRGISPDWVDALVITGNTVMLYLLTEQNPKALSRAPFLADRLFGQWLEARELELPVAPTAAVYLPRCISAFVGGDITTAVMASGICESHQTALLVDIGTNGEMVLWHQGVLTCCSTAAGPAFEGAGISHGVYGIAGAIDWVWEEEGHIRCSTIDGVPAVGICGSGIVDGVAVMLKLGIIDETGAFAGAEGFFELQNGIGITPEDIRKVQLAKGSIRAGMETLLHIAKVSSKEVEALLIAGGFGRYLNLENGANIGLIPQELLPRSQVMGNAAHLGASLLLQQKGLVKVSEQMASKAHTVELSANPVFAEHYINYMMFE